MLMALFPSLDVVSGGRAVVLFSFLSFPALECRGPITAFCRLGQQRRRMIAVAQSALSGSPQIFAFFPSFFRSRDS